MRALPARLRSAADSAVSAHPLRPWDPPRPGDPLLESAELDISDDTGPQIVLDDAPQDTVAAPASPAARSPRPAQRASAFSKQIAPRAAALGRQLAPRAAAFGRRLGPLARQGLRATGRRLADLRPLLRLLGHHLGRFLAAVGGLTLHLLGGLAHGSTVVGDRTAGAMQRHQDVLFALFVRALWWTALVLLFLGGRALIDIHAAPAFSERALPVFLTGLALCGFLLVAARPARLRWAAFALGLGHGGLLALVWVVSAAG